MNDIHNDTPENFPFTPEPLTETDLIGLMNQLESLLAEGPPRSRGMLMRQSDILDSLFNALVAANLQEAVTAKFYGKADHATTAGWLHMALQTQRQCMESLKTASAIGYMDKIAGQITSPPTPSPKYDERTS